MSRCYFSLLEPFHGHSGTQCFKKWSVVRNKAPDHYVLELQKDNSHCILELRVVTTLTESLIHFLRYTHTLTQTSISNKQPRPFLHHLKIIK